MVGAVTIYGLDAGSYVLKETTVPAGYNAIGDTTVEITAAHGETDGTDHAKLDLGSSEMAKTVINQAGAVLPSTGGMGTRIFYILGAMLVLGAGVLLAAKRRIAA